MRRSRLWVPLLVLAALWGCKKHTIRFGEVSPTPTAKQYERIREAWTRTATDYIDLVATAVVHVTYKSWELRQAQVRLLAKELKMNRRDELALLQAEEADWRKYHTLFVSVATNQQNWNNLERKKESIWYLQLENGGGTRIKSDNVQSLNEESPKFRTLYPFISPFARIYLVRFPKSVAPLIGASTRLLRFEMRSVVAKLRFEWKLPGVR
ncbi:MAG: hypothetical protein KC609_15585 [Myxococcales bacterium]|nr:hypothetical protein [Myxococcales bacterium]